MNSIFNEKDKKDIFMVKSLLPYLAKHIENSTDSKETADKVAGMFIYPYRTKDGVRIGSMNEPNVKWYFVADSDTKTVSAGGYRIFAHEVLSPDTATLFKSVLGKYCDFHEYSDNVVIEDLITRMSKETYYSNVWWTYVYDVFKLWSPDKFNVNLSAATDNIDSDSFLFVEEYCDSRIKNYLLEDRVFTDIVDDESKRLFWNYIKTKEQKNNAVQLLIHMGVPHSFTNNGEVNSNILWFVKKIEEEISFPASGKEDIEKCSVCHTVCMDIIFNESESAFDTMVSDEEYYGGIVLKNVLGRFVPLSWDLFYDSNTEENADDEKRIRNVNTYFEDYRVDFKDYGGKRLDLMCNQIHAFSSVDNEISDFNIKWNGHPADFYKWVWAYSHSRSIADLALYSLSGERTIDKVPSEYIEFVIDILKTVELEKDGYSLAIPLDPKKLFIDANLWNQVGKKFDKIYAVIDEEVTPIDVTEFVDNIIEASQSDYSVKGEIEKDSIWQHVYLVNGEVNKFIYSYVKAYRRDDNDDYEEAIFLWPSDDTDSYVSALAAYVSDKYEIEVAIASAQAFDWKQEYMKLVKGIRLFISEQRDIKSADDIFGYIVEADDVKNFGQEKVIWEKMVKQRDAIMQQTTRKFPVNLRNGREFLFAKYYGRCQLCGGKIDKGDQDSYYWKFRMVKPSRNQLVDMHSNMFCLCPSCHGEMGYGNYMGKDMSSVIEKAKMYADYIEEKINSGEFKDYYPSLIQEVFEMNSIPEEDEEKLEGFHNPIVCDVVINGKRRYMAFSWEHFMKLAFVFSKLNDFSDEESTFEDIEMEKLIRPDV